MNYNTQRSQFGYTPTNYNNSNFNTEFQGNSVGGQQNMQPQQNSQVNSGYSVPNYNTTDTSFQQFQTDPLVSGTETSAASQGLGSVGKAIPVYGQIASGVEAVAKPIQENLMSVDEETGSYDNFNQALAGNQMKKFLDPAGNALDVWGDEDATKGEKVLAGINAVFPGMGSFGSKAATKRREAANQEKVAQAKSEEQAYLDQQIEAGIRKQRLSSLSQDAPSYGSVFKNGGFIRSYNDGGPMNVTSNDGTTYEKAKSYANTDLSDFSPNKQFDAPSYNTRFPFTMEDGSNYYLTPTTVKTSGNPAFKQFNDKYSYYTDSTLIPDYGNTRGASFDPKTGIHYSGDTKGNTDKMQQAYNGKLNMNTLPYSHKNGGFMEQVNKNPDVTYFQNGGTHGQNSLGGIPQGKNANVEEGEFKVKLKDQEYIFSDRF